MSALAATPYKSLMPAISAAGKVTPMSVVLNLPGSSTISKTQDCIPLHTNGIRILQTYDHEAKCSTILCPQIIFYCPQIIFQLYRILLSYFSPSIHTIFKSDKRVATLRLSHYPPFC